MSASMYKSGVTIMHILQGLQYGADCALCNLEVAINKHLKSGISQHKPSAAAIPIRINIYEYLHCLRTCRV
eukprot:1156924-Pelagomonas_calceolata.AAC.10